MVVSCPGEVFHWTVSLGYSVAEASNCFIQLPETPSLVETVQHWDQHVEEAAADWQAWQAANPDEAEAIEKPWENRMANSQKVKAFLGLA
ncbi:hypothetical protein WJX72_007480 [[Myrmecia] bisecta]|uniref:Uncharacterized protein n=1 Tax=[Myrmecia] bisecta TaxID=41462 RepID=A0AAW1Q3E6_9CHLO